MVALDRKEGPLPRSLPVAQALCNLLDINFFFSNVFIKNLGGDHGPDSFLDGSPAEGSRWTTETKHRHFVSFLVLDDRQLDRRMCGPCAVTGKWGVTTHQNNL